MAVLDIMGRYYRMYPQERFLGEAEERLHLETTETAFLVNHVQNDPTGNSFWMVSQKSSRIASEVIAEHMKPALQWARRIGLPVVYLRSGDRAHVGLEKGQSNIFDDLTMRRDLWGGNNRTELTKKYPEMWQIHNELKPEDTDYIVDKWAYSGFLETHLDRTLRTIGAKNLICVGLATNACLYSTIFDAAELDYHVIVLRDCTVAVEYPDTEAEMSETARTIRQIESFVGFTADSSDFIAAARSIEASKTLPRTA